MSSRRRSRPVRRKRKQPKGSRGGSSFEGLSPKQMQRALGQIDTNEIDDVVEVIVRTSQEEIVLENPEVTVMNMGQEIWSIVPQSTSTRPLSSLAEEEDQVVQPVEVSEEDVKLVSTTANVSEEKAKEAIRKAGGDIAAAIMSLR